MSHHPERRRDLVTSQQITQALRLAAEYGYDRARRHMEQAGIPNELMTQLLLTRYDRRSDRSATVSAHP